MEKRGHFFGGLSDAGGFDALASQHAELAPTSNGLNGFLPKLLER